MKNTTLLIALCLIPFFSNAQDCNCNSITDNLTIGTGSGEGRLITSFGDNKIFDFYYPRYRGGWKWTTNSSEGITQIMELRSHYNRGTNINLTLGSGSNTGVARFTTNIADNSVLEFYIPRWRGGWKWTTSSSNGKITAMHLHNKNNGGNVELRLDGRLLSSEVKVQSNVWPDFVFEDGYDLPSLQEAEAHIREKGHLKGIPSAEEVVENGIYLGEMNAKLLQKIEELMLYTIQQENQLKKQRKINQKLEGRLQRIEKHLNRLK